MSIRSAISSGRRLMRRTMLDDVQIADRTQVRDGMGGTRDAWVLRDVVLKARFADIDDKDARPIAGTTYGAAAANVHLPLGTAVSEGDRIYMLGTITATNPQTGEVTRTSAKPWTVVARQSPPGSFALDVELIVREVGG